MRLPVFHALVVGISAAECEWLEIHTCIEAVDGFIYDGSMLLTQVLPLDPLETSGTIEIPVHLPSLMGPIRPSRGLNI